VSGGLLGMPSSPLVGDMYGLSPTFGYKMRQPYPSEQTYFSANPSVAGMAAEDGQITLNPYSALSPQERAAVARNEAARLWMRENNVNPNFDVTHEQFRSFQGTPYGLFSNYVPMKQTLAARVMSGDPSAGQATPEQTQFVNSMLGKLRAR
jgi:hypothetical protein